jgi:hypothetical protein
MSSLYEKSNRYRFVANDILGDLYAAKKNLKELRYEIGLIIIIWKTKHSTLSQYSPKTQ